MIVGLAYDHIKPLPIPRKVNEMLFHTARDNMNSRLKISKAFRAGLEQHNKAFTSPNWNRQLTTYTVMSPQVILPFPQALNVYRKVLDANPSKG